MNSLIALDHFLFAKINSDWTNGFFDWLLPAITDLHKNPKALIALMPLLLFWFWRRRSYALKTFFLLIISIALADTVSYRVVKSVTQRDRPQFVLAEIKDQAPVQLRTHQHSGSSFPSNHAANMFAAARLLALAHPGGALIFYVIAGAVAYSRVYVGVHFPFDVMTGALLGFLISTIVWKLLHRLLKLRPN